MVETFWVMKFSRPGLSPLGQAIPALPNEEDEDERVEDEGVEDGDGAGVELDIGDMDWGVVTATDTDTGDGETLAEGGDRALHRALPEDRLTGERRAAICWCRAK
jgi:hypothetical protein